MKNNRKNRKALKMAIKKGLAYRKSLGMILDFKVRVKDLFSPHIWVIPRLEAKVINVTFVIDDVKKVHQYEWAEGMLSDITPNGRIR